MQNTERLAGVWRLSCGVVLGAYLLAPAYASTLVELDAFSGKMLNDVALVNHGNAVVDSADAVSSDLISTGGVPTLNAIVNGATRKIVNDSSGGITTLVEKSGGGSRRIMWRQIQ